jgi:hypothetical protein
LVAVTVKVYAVPSVSPTTVAGLVAGVTPVQPPHAGDGITVYPLIADPLLAGAVQETLTVPLLLATPLTAPGAPGGSAGVIPLDAAEAAPAPEPLVAVTVKVYAVPRVSPTTVAAAAAGDPVTVTPVQPPHAGEGVTTYWVIVSPLFEGAVQVRLTVPLLLAAPVTPVGAPGTPSSVTPLDADEAAPVPIPLVAVTVKVYDVPTVSPVTVAGLLVGVTPVQPPHAGDGITVYPVIADPLAVGAVQLTVTVPVLLAVALTAVGAPGTAMSVWLAEAAEAVPVPIPLVAVTVKVYPVPMVSPVTVADAVVGVTPVQPEHAGDGITV